jgi:hypothetical protein
MNDPNVYSILNISHENGSIWFNLLTTVIGAFLGGFIVYFFNIRIEKRKERELEKRNFNNLKFNVIETTEELKTIAYYLAEYKSKGEFQIRQKELGQPFNENLYNIRASKFDDFRLQYAHVKSRFIFELKMLKSQCKNNNEIDQIIEKVKDYSHDLFIDFSNHSLKDEHGNYLTENDVDSMVNDFRKKPNSIFYLLNTLVNILDNLTLKSH